MNLRAVAFAFVALSASACIVGEDGEVEDGVFALPAGAGNGAPSGTHYNLNIIGVSKGKSPNLSGGDGHRIFVPLYASARINLAEGDCAVQTASPLTHRQHVWTLYPNRLA